ncbi:MAG: flagellar hook-length control protein FliK [Deltaproteobacteria bacterium]|nr:flagellar hook-length control protein FliK [Deltaproteobacteria bacterium]
MNILPINNQQAVLSPEQKSQKLDPIQANLFQGELSIAENDISWIKKDASVIEKERLSHHQTQEKQETDILDQMLQDQMVATAFVEKGIQQASQQETSFLKRFQNENSVSANLMESRMIRQLDESQQSLSVRQMDFHNQQKSLKDNSFDQAVEEKITIKNPHLINPTLVTDENGQPDRSALEQFRQKETDSNLKTGDQPIIKPQDSEMKAAQTSNKAHLDSFSMLSRDMMQQKTVSQDRAGLATGGLQKNQEAKTGQVGATGSKPEGVSATQKSGMKIAPLDSAQGQNASTNATAEKTGISTKRQVKNGQAQVQQEQHLANIKNVVGKIRLMLNDQKNELVIKLNPEHLGKLEIRLKKNGDELQGLLKVDNIDAKKLIESQMSHLKQGLEDQGVKIEHFTILLNDEAAKGGMGFSMDHGQGKQNESLESSVGTKSGVTRPIETAESIPSFVAKDNSDEGLNIYA